VTQAQDLAQLSNTLVYSAMFVLTLAMFAFAAAFAGRRAADRTVEAEAIAAAEQQRVPVGAVLGTAPPAEAGSAAEPTVVEEPGRRAGNIGIALSWLAFGLLVGGVVARGVWAGRVPWGNMYEFSLTSAMAVLGVYLGVSTRRDVRWLGVFIIPLVLLTLGLAVTVLYTEAAQLVPALQSYWLVIHVSTAIVCGGAFTVAGVVAALYLVVDGAAQSGWRSRFAARLPSAERLDRLAYRTIAFTFPLWTFAIVAGAIWAESAWGRYWGWDPKETWAFITWVVYAAYLHARSTAGWRGRKAAWLGVAGTVVFWFNYFAVNLLFSGLHSYSGV
jgi:cytochrome c-type biogenesis protein CcsB